MAANTTLITPAEVIRYSPTDSHNAAQPTCNHILQKEEKLFRECLGMNFYKDLIADKAAYPTYTTFTLSTIYNINDVVDYEGTLFICIQLTTGAQSPQNELFFEVAPKFNNADYEYLWVRYLRLLIAYSVIYTSVVYRAVQDTDQGLVRKKSDNFEPAKMSDVMQLKHEYEGDIRDVFNNMEAYIRENKAAFPNYMGFAKDGCGGDKGVCKVREADFFGFNLSEKEATKSHNYNFNDPL